jgi:hypothetical protein
VLTTREDIARDYLKGRFGLDLLPLLAMAVAFAGALPYRWRLLLLIWYCKLAKLAYLD